MKTSSRLNLPLRLIKAGLATILPAAMLMLGAQTSMAGSASWLSFPYSQAWYDVNGANWTLGGPPNGPSDVATFNTSSITAIFVCCDVIGISVDSIVFNGDAFTITVYNGASTFLAFYGAGITNNSGNTQNFVAGNAATIYFFNSATAGINTVFSESAGGGFLFLNNSTAANGTFIANAGGTSFIDNSTAANGTFIANGGTVSSGARGSVQFGDNSTAANGAFIANGGTVSGAPGGVTEFVDTSTAANGAFIANGGTDGGDGGSIVFANDSTGGTARVELFGNGTLALEHNAPGLTIGSIEGTGNVFLGLVSLDGSQHLTVGSNNLSTTFSGVIRDNGQGGLFTKIGSGILTFQGRPTNDYIADTVSLNLVSGSIINLNFTGAPDTIYSLIVNGVPQMPGVYGGPASGAPHQLPEFAGTGTVQVMQAPHPAFFTGETALGGGWYYLQFANGTPFGYYSYLSDQNFIYHIDLGFEYLFDANDANHGIYFYDFASSSFFYTSPTLFPDLYGFSLNAWLYYLPDVNNPGRYTQNPRWFYNFATGQWITL